MRGNLVQLTLGGYLYETPGIIENISITLPDQATWEIGIPVNEEDNTRFFASPTRFTGDNVQELPHRLEISMTFRPIHNFIPEIVKNINGGQNIKQRFLSLANGNPTIASANLYAGPQNGSGKYVGVPNQFKINDTSTAITSPATQGQDIVAPETSTPLRFSSQVRRPGLGINQLSDEALINLGN
jgi:hypothetical protein